MSSTGRSSRRLPRWTTAALLAGVAVQLLPLAVFPTVLSQDGPAHVASAWVLLHSGDDGAVGSLLREHYDTDLSPVPNMFTTLVLAVLLPVLGPDAAERLFVAGFVVALVAALAYALRGVDRRAGWLAVGALPFAGSHLVAYGFYNYCWGMVGALVVLGLVLRRRDGWSVPATAALAAALLATWTMHLLPFGVAAGGAVALAAGRAAVEVRGGSSLRAAGLRHVAPVVLAALPSAVLTAVYLRSGQAPVEEAFGGPSASRLRLLLSGDEPFVGGGAEERPAALAVVCALYLLGAAVLWSRWRRPERSPGPEGAVLGVLLVVLTAAYWVTPDRFGTEFGFLDERLAWFPPLLLLLWSATALPGALVRNVVVGVLVVAASAAVVVRLPAQREAADDVAELLSIADSIEPASTLVVLRYSPPLRIGVPEPIRHESSRLALRSGAVDVGHYEAVHPYFQVTFAGGPEVWRSIDPRLEGLERVPPVIDLDAARGALDYVVVVGLDRAAAQVRAGRATRAVLAELSAHYEEVETSGPTGLVTLWRAAG